MPSREIVIVLATAALFYYLGKKGILSGIIPGV